MITIYNSITQTKGGKDIPFDIFLDNIKDGKWQDYVIPIRAMKTKEERDAAKKKVPYATISGQFDERKDNSVFSHSGFIGIDIDKVDPEETKRLITSDQYCYSAFTSISSNGVCMVVKINGEKHRESYYAIREYLFEKYRIITDDACVNPSRARFISYDPFLFINHKAEKFTAIPKKKAEKTIPKIVFVQNDFEMIVKEIQSRRIDITGSYTEWLSIAYGIAHQYGPSGEDYFLSISEQSTKYDSDIAKRQYAVCLKESASQKKATIGSVYYYAKQAGIATVSAQTKLISQAATYAKKGGRTPESVVIYLKDAEGIDPKESKDVVTQVFQNNIDVKTEDSIIEQLRDWLKMEYDVRRNEITRKIEVNSKEMDDVIFNDVFCGSKIIFEKVNAELLQRVIYSSHTAQYNPFMQFFEKHSHSKPKGVIREFFSCIDSDTGFENFFPDYVYYFSVRWLVGVIASMHGKHSPLMLVFSGQQGNGKTEFFRQLLPSELQPYFAESKMDNGKDDDILMCKKILIFDDEMSGKSKKEEKRMKELLSKSVITVREPYGRFSIDMKRLSVFCGTTNDHDILNDPTGNRRVIPVHVISIDFEKINKIDRVSLIMEAYWLYKDGFAWELSSADVKILNDNTGFFEQPSPENDLITKYYSLPDKNENNTIFLSTTEIKSFIETRTMQKLSTTKIGIELRKMGCERVAKKIIGCVIKGYQLIERSNSVAALPFG